MDISAKRVINNLYYYTVALFVLLFSILFMVSMADKALSTYQMVVYYIWAVLAIVLVIADVIATMMGKYKFIIGLCIYGMMILAVIVGFIVFAGMQVGGVIPAASTNIFNTLILFSVGITIGLIVMHSLGYRLMALNNDNE